MRQASWATKLVADDESEYDLNLDVYTIDDEENDEKEEWFRDEPIEEGDQNSKWPRIKVSREERTKWYVPLSPTDDISKSILYRVKDYFVANLANCMYIYL